MANEQEKPISLAEAQKRVDHWIQTVGQRYFKELTNTALLMEEVGELSRYMSRIYGEQSFKDKKSLEQAKAEMADEMGDVLFVLLCLANQTEVDLTEVFRKNLDKKTERDERRHRDNPKL
jgi:NTP pyrophosphatase (non-canonical NTP hydrolase)